MQRSDVMSGDREQMTTHLPNFDLDGFLPYRLTVAAEMLSAEFAAHYRAEYGISVAEWRVMVHLVHSVEVSVRDLEARVSLEKSKASRAASRLGAEGYIRKAAHDRDRRLVNLSLTEKGRKLMARLLPVAIAYQTELEARLVGQVAPLLAALVALEHRG